MLAERQQSKDLLGPGAGNEALLAASPKFGDEKITDAWEKFKLKIGEDAQKARDKILKDEESHGGPFAVQNEAYKKRLKENDEVSTNAYTDSVKRAKLVEDSDKAAAQLQQERAIRIAELQGGPGGEGRAIQLGTQMRVNSATDLRSSQMADIQPQLDALNALTTKTKDDKKQIEALTTQGLEVELAYNKEIAETRMDAELKLLELRQKELDSYKQEAASIFDALRQPGGRGMQQWFRGQTTDLAKGVFGNATAPILQNIGQSLGGATAGAPSYVQGLFKGTIFDSAHAKSAQIDATPQIDATYKNTLALLGLTDTLTGQHTAGASTINYAPGSIAANAAALGGPMALPTLRGSSNIYSDMASAPLSLGGGSGSDSLAMPNSLNALELGSFSKALQAPTTLQSLLKGATTGVGNWDEIFNPDATDANGDTYSMASKVGAGIGTLTTAGAGIYESVNQFGKGGASGMLGGLGSASLTAGALAGGPSNPVGGALDIFGTIMELFKGLMPDPITLREAQIANQEQYSTYVAPPTLNRSLSASGGFEQVNNKYGMPSATTYSSVAIEAPYKYQSPIKDPSGLYQNSETAPGQVLEPYQQAAAQPGFMTSQAPTIIQQNFHFTGLDAQSFLDNSGKIASAVQKEVIAGHPVGSALQRSILGN